MNSLLKVPWQEVKKRGKGESEGSMGRKKLEVRKKVERKELSKITII